MDGSDEGEEEMKRFLYCVAIAVSISDDFYKFVTFENSPIYLPDLLGSEE